MNPLPEETPVSREARDRRRAVDALAPWFHNIHLPDGLQTAPDHALGDFPDNMWRLFRDQLPNDLHGWRVLDIGCNAGFYSFEMARRGARVTAIDNNATYLHQARWAAAQLGLSASIDFEQLPVYALGRRRECYDLVLFMGVFYHLRHPLLALDIVARRTTRLMVFQTLSMPGDEVFETGPDRVLNDRDAFHEKGWPKMAFIEHSMAGDPTNWWAANHAGVLAMLRSSGLRPVAVPAKEIYICEPNQAPSWTAEFISNDLNALFP